MKYRIVFQQLCTSNFFFTKTNEVFFHGVLQLFSSDMMTTKPELQTCAQDECGVWLDPVQLKVKTKQVTYAHLFLRWIRWSCVLIHYRVKLLLFIFQKRVRRPISKLLNPFAKGGGYSLAVALNFTQTKTEMPKTKQSSISTFFAPQRRSKLKTLAIRLLLYPSFSN